MNIDNTYGHAILKWGNIVEFWFLRKSNPRLSSEHESNISIGGTKNKRTRGHIEDQYDAAPINYVARPTAVATECAPSPKPPHSRTLKQQQTLPASEQPVLSRHKLKVYSMSYRNSCGIIKRVWQYEPSYSLYYIFRSPLQVKVVAALFHMLLVPHLSLWILSWQLQPPSRQVCYALVTICIYELEMVPNIIP